MAYVLDKYPFTEAGKKLNLPEDIFNQCKLVYRLNKDLGLWIFEEFFSPDEEYDDERVILPFQSVHGGVKSCRKGMVFSNVLGSSNDPKDNDLSWIALMRYVYKVEKLDHMLYKLQTCCTDGQYYDPTCLRKKVPIPLNNGGCNSIVVGGHVLLGKREADVVLQGGSLHLLPICNRHNVKNLNGYTGGGFFMVLGTSIHAVELHQYKTCAEIEKEIQNEYCCE